MGGPPADGRGAGNRRHLELQNAALRRAQAELAAARARYFDLFDLAPVAYVSLSEAGLIQEANLAAATWLGVARGALIQQPLAHFILNDDRASYSRYRQQLIEGAAPQACELRMRHKDGAPVWALLAATLVPDPAGQPLWRVVLTDITERKQAALALQDLNQTLESRVARRTMQLRQSEARFSQLAEATFEGVAISEDGILLDGNPQLAALHGYEPAEMNGRPLADFVAPESRAMVATRIGDAIDSTCEFVGLRKDGSRFPAESHARMGTWLGSRMRISAVRDLTTVKQALARLHAQQAELEHAQRLALVSEISAGIIHQLGQPLSAMAANLAVVKLGCAGHEPRCRESLEIVSDIEADVARMRNIVIHLRALADPEHPDRVGINCNEIVAEVLPLLRQKAEARQIRLSLELDDALPAVVGDVVQLSQVILNLVSNAFDAAEGCAPERRGVLITTRALAGYGVELSVRDTGCGIAPEALARMFTPFFSTKPEGLGVGLRLSRTIVEAHRGSIQGCNNADGIGATFWVRLPATPP